MKATLGRTIEELSVYDIPFFWLVPLESLICMRLLLKVVDSGFEQYWEDRKESRWLASKVLPFSVRFAVFLKIFCALVSVKGEVLSSKVANRAFFALVYKIIFILK
jgi:hypothetical protein